MTAANDAHYAALARWLAAQHVRGRPLVVGLNGTQGSGKSTLAARLQILLDGMGLRLAVLALDDFYRTRAERAALAAAVHPLLQTRGVPGTHDVALLGRTLEQLRAGESVRVPVFVKARDDRAPESEWRNCAGPADVILLEGWCVGTPPQAEAALAAPVNALEATEDADGRWRRFANEQLATGYAALFAKLDRLVLLQAPGFEGVRAWREEQEAGNAAAVPGARAMTPAQLERFIAHYERLTRHALRVLPARADAVLVLDAQRRVTAARYR